MEGIKLLQGDNVTLMKEMEDECIDLTVTSPPYDNLRTYGGNLEWDFECVAQELYRVTKKGGVVVWNVSDATIDGSETGTSFRQALYFMSLGFKLHDTMLYAKANPMPLSHNRYEQQFEYMFVFSKGRTKTFNPIMEPCKNAGKIHTGGTQRHNLNELTPMHGIGKPVKDEKQKNNIWFYPVETTVKGHPAVFPIQLAKDHILSWSNEGDTVLDPFSGSGTTMLACIQTNRKGIGLEKNEQYFNDSLKRLTGKNPLADIDAPNIPLEQYNKNKSPTLFDFMV